MKKREFMGGLLGVGLTSVVPQLRAQKIPVVQLIVPFSAGGLADSVARLLASTMQRLSNQTVVVVNRAGASGIVAAGTLMRSRPDEAVFMLSGTSQLLQPLVAQHQSSVRDVFEGLRHSYLLCQQDSFWVVSRASTDFFNLNRNRDSVANLGSLGIGSAGHLLGASLAREANMTHVHVPYNGSPALAQGLLSGNIDYAFMAYENFRSHIVSGGIVPMAVASEKKSALLPNVPTVTSLGFKSVNRGTWLALTHSANADERMLSSIFADMKNVFTDKHFLSGITEMGLTPNFLSGEKLKNFIASDQSYWAERIAKVM
jgi:tripartite-type tricarboxylate transporter receptor subunit TctC